MKTETGNPASQVPDFCYPLEPVTFQWGARGVGWGQVVFFHADGNRVHCHNEMMSKEFLKQILCRMIDECTLMEPPPR